MMTTLKMFLCILIFSGFLNMCSAEYNLYGDAGQAYSIKVNLGHPHQTLKLLVDTGSTTLAIASQPHEDSSVYFHSDNSTSLHNNGKEVQAKYSQGMWEGQLVSDYIQFPSLPKAPEVRCDIALITKSVKFFMNGSGWQGLLGLAYKPVGAWGDNVIVDSWLDTVDQEVGKPMSFLLQLCGVKSLYSASHYGRFDILDDNSAKLNSKTMLRTPIIRKRWYEIGVLSIRTVYNHLNETQDDKNSKQNKDSLNYFEDMCVILNAEKSIVDSGTTSIRLPQQIFTQVVDELRKATQESNVLILRKFWYQGEAACWTEPQEWNLPLLAIDLLSADSDTQYFTLEIPPQNYMRVVTARRGQGGEVAEFCYKLGLEGGGTETVLGYTALEGLEVLFNRSAGWIGWQTSNCGPNARVTGPFNTTTSLKKLCQLIKPEQGAEISIKAAQWTLCVISIIAGVVLMYLLAPCVKMMLIRRLTLPTQISLSEAALFEAES